MLNMNEAGAFRKLGEEVYRLGLPYQCDMNKAESLQKEVDAWLRHPDNDCLRARGDWRWIKMCDFDAELRLLMKPF